MNNNEKEIAVEKVPDVPSLNQISVDVIVQHAPEPVTRSSSSSRATEENSSRETHQQVQAAIRRQHLPLYHHQYQQRRLHQLQNPHQQSKYIPSSNSARLSSLLQYAHSDPWTTTFPAAAAAALLIHHHPQAVVCHCLHPSYRCQLHCQPAMIPHAATQTQFHATTINGRAVLVSGHAVITVPDFQILRQVPIHQKQQWQQQTQHQHQHQHPLTRQDQSRKKRTTASLLPQSRPTAATDGPETHAASAQQQESPPAKTRVPGIPMIAEDSGIDDKTRRRINASNALLSTLGMDSGLTMTAIKISTRESGQSVPSDKVGDDLFASLVSFLFKADDFDFAPTTSNGQSKEKSPVLTDEQGCTYVENIRTYDVLCGRGGRCHCHMGNVRFRSVVKLLKNGYKTVEGPKSIKTDVSRAVVAHVTNYGGLFINPEEKNGVVGKFYVLSQKDSRKKASQALREC